MAVSMEYQPATYSLIDPYWGTTNGVLCPAFQSLKRAISWMPAPAMRKCFNYDRMSYFFYMSLLMEIIFKICKRYI